LLPALTRKHYIQARFCNNRYTIFWLGSSLAAQHVGLAPSKAQAQRAKWPSTADFQVDFQIVRNLDDSIRAAIELHDLPAPDDEKTSEALGGGCPVPPVQSGTNIDYGPSPADVICPAYDSAVSKVNRSDSREVIRRFRALSPRDQQALIEFLKQL
jgi:hypothetical protein